MEKIKVNQDACIGCGACVAIADEVFDFNDEGFAETKENNNILDKMDEELKDRVMDALEGCPTSAIEKDNDEELKDEVIDTLKGSTTSAIEKSNDEELKDEVIDTLKGSTTSAIEKSNDED